MESELEKLANTPLTIDTKDRDNTIKWISELVPHLYTANLTDWEQDFVNDIYLNMKQTGCVDLTDKQLETLGKIHRENREWL